MPPSFIFQCKIVIGRVECNHSSIVFDPSGFALHTPEMVFVILNHQVVALLPAINGKNSITELEEASNNCCLANVADSVGIPCTFCRWPHIFFFQNRTQYIRFSIFVVALHILFDAIHPHMQSLLYATFFMEASKQAAFYT